MREEVGVREEGVGVMRMIGGLFVFSVSFGTCSNRLVNFSRRILYSLISEYFPVLKSQIFGC